ncbi:serine hydrolase domain-containing protein [Bacteroidota bacterium]
MKIKHVISTFIIAVLYFGLLVSPLFFTGLAKTGSPGEQEIPLKTQFPPHLGSSLKKYSQFLTTEFHSTHSVGAAVTIVYKDSIIFTRTMGVKKVNSPDIIDEHTVFRLASVSKGFTGVLACLLEQQNILRLQDKVIDYLPGFKLKDSAHTAQLTIKQTLNHTTGLIPHSYDDLAEAGKSLEEIVNRLHEVKLYTHPGKLYSYQNVAFSLISLIAREKTKKSYEELMHEKIFQPLDMKDASVGLSSLTEMENLAYPHVRARGNYATIPLNGKLYNIAPAAGINVSISDMGKWLLALLGNYEEVINSDLLDSIAKPGIQTPLKKLYTKYWKTVDEKYYGLGWRIYKFKGRDIVYHGGYVKGYSAEIAYSREDSVGIAFLQNSPNRLSLKSIPEFFTTYFSEIDTLSSKKPGEVSVLTQKDILLNPNP